MKVDDIVRVKDDGVGLMNALSITRPLAAMPRRARRTENMINVERAEFVLTKDCSIENNKNRFRRGHIAAAAAVVMLHDFDSLS